MSKYRIADIITDEEELHKESLFVLPNSKAAVEAKAALLKVFNAHKGAMKGLSAVQVGHRVNVVLIRWNKWDTPVIYYNVKVKFKFGSKDSNEGCESEGPTRYIVKRPLLAFVEYQDEDCKVHKEWLSYTKARVFCHEYDHTIGRLLKDHGKAVT